MKDLVFGSERLGFGSERSSSGKWMKNNLSERRISSGSKGKVFDKLSKVYQMGSER